MSNFGTIKTNVGNRVGDTSTSFATQIGVYINQRYSDVLGKINWNVINEGYVLTATSASSDYSLPSNFGSELYVWDSVHAKDIPYLSLEKLEQEYTSSKNNTGTVNYYTIFYSNTSTAASSAATSRKIRFSYFPTTDTTFEIPYSISSTNLVADADVPMLDCDICLEYGACADAWATKRQMAKSQYYEQLYSAQIQDLIWAHSNQNNQLPMMNPLALDRNAGID